MSSRIIVTNLWAVTTEETLRQMLSRSGLSGQEIRIVVDPANRRHRWAVVEMGTPENAEAAVQRCHGQPLDGSIVEVSVLRRRTTGSGAGWRTWAIRVLAPTCLYALIWATVIAPDPTMAYKIDVSESSLGLGPVSGITFRGDEWSAPPGTVVPFVGNGFAWSGGSHVRIEVDSGARTTGFRGLKFTESCEVRVLEDGTLTLDNWNLVATDSKGRRWRTRWCRIGWRITLALFPE